MASPPRIDANLARVFYSAWRLPMPTAWDYAKAETLPAVRVAFADRVARLGARSCNIPYPKLECFLVAGGDAWLVSPCLWDNRDRPERLWTFSASLPGSDTGEMAPVEVQWPKTQSKEDASKQGDPNLAHVACWDVTTDSDGADTVWIGTMDQGLARFEKKDGKWIGRWYAGRQGMPADRVDTIIPFRSDKRQKLLLVGGGPRDRRGSRLFVWTLEADSGEVRILTEMEAAYAMGRLTAVWPDGRKAPLSICGESDQDGLDLEKVREIVPLGPKVPDWPAEGVDLRVMRAGGEMRLWQVGNGRRSVIQEISPSSLEALHLSESRGPGHLRRRRTRPVTLPVQQPGLAWSRRRAARRPAGGGLLQSGGRTGHLDDRQAL
jgi:hypothetical protein